MNHDLFFTPAPSNLTVSGAASLARWAREILAAVGLAALALVAMAGPAAAHGGPGVIDVGDPETTGELQIEFPVRITYENDGHPAEEVEGLTVAGRGPDGAELAPTDAFVPGDAPGVFRATVTLPVEGQWELTVDAVEPAATATITADVTGPVVPEDDGAPDDGTTPGAPDDGAAPDSGSGAPDDEGATDDLDGATAPLTATEGDDDAFPWVAVVIALVVAGAAAVVGFRLARR